MKNFIATIRGEGFQFTMYGKGDAVAAQEALEAAFEGTEVRVVVDTGLTAQDLR